MSNDELIRHANALANQLAECAGYMATVNTERQIIWHESLYALQTVEWAEGAAKIAERANRLLEAHDDLQVNGRDQRRPTPDTKPNL